MHLFINLFLDSPKFRNSLGLVFDMAIKDRLNFSSR
ncbi:hypothetical protein HNQ88_001502 [Aureibacter tunicatorum]|uniref:Uncharacterized protein n=1 Tax=Aureibacter tunicatorum TaxID=866807 RepID=A0AAE4BS35_9BACT|nr:hypothetical protein [Aureibacter tunicatorum]